MLELEPKKTYRLFRMMSNPIEIEIEAIYDDLIFCEILSIVFEVHRAVKKGQLFTKQFYQDFEQNVFNVFTKTF